MVDRYAWNYTKQMGRYEDRQGDLDFIAKYSQARGIGHFLLVTERPFSKLFSQKNLELKSVFRFDRYFIANSYKLNCILKVVYAL